ncbi:MAG: hypothetical protein Q4C55_09245 [Eubacterium sp.]|nr:hypothetical protein [Eubacterium sp.]
MKKPEKYFYPVSAYLVSGLTPKHKDSFFNLSYDRKMLKIEEIKPKLFSENITCNTWKIERENIKSLSFEIKEEITYNRERKTSSIGMIAGYAIGGIVGAYIGSNPREVMEKNITTRGFLILQLKEKDVIFEIKERDFKLARKFVSIFNVRVHYKG